MQKMMAEPKRRRVARLLSPSWSELSDVMPGGGLPVGVVLWFVKNARIAAALAVGLLETASTGLWLTRMDWLRAHNWRVARRTGLPLDRIEGDALTEAERKLVKGADREVSEQARRRAVLPVARFLSRGWQELAELAGWLVRDLEDEPPIILLEDAGLLGEDGGAFLRQLAQPERAEFWPGAAVVAFLPVDSPTLTSSEQLVAASDAELTELLRSEPELIENADLVGFFAPNSDLRTGEGILRMRIP